MCSVYTSISCTGHCSSPPSQPHVLIHKHDENQPKNHACRLFSCFQDLYEVCKHATELKSRTYLHRALIWRLDVAKVGLGLLPGIWTIFRNEGHANGQKQTSMLLCYCLRKDIYMSLFDSRWPILEASQTLLTKDSLTTQFHHSDNRHGSSRDAWQWWWRSRTKSSNGSERAAELNLVWQAAAQRWLLSAAGQQIWSESKWCAQQSVPSTSAGPLLPLVYGARGAEAAAAD